MKKKVIILVIILLIAAGIAADYVIREKGGLGNFMEDSCDTDGAEEIFIKPGEKLTVDEVLNVSGTLTVNREDLDVTKGRIRLEAGSTMKMDDVTIEVTETNDNMVFGPMYRSYNHIDLYERNGKLKFTGGHIATVNIKVPKGKKFEDYFAATNLGRDTVIFCNGVQVTGTVVDFSDEIDSCTEGTVLVTEDAHLIQDNGYASYIPRGVMVEVLPGNEISIERKVTLRGTIKADREGFSVNQNMGLYIFDGGKLDLGDIVIECEALDDSKNSYIRFEASYGVIPLSSKACLRGGRNAKVKIEIPEEYELKDIFDLEDMENVEFYVNGSKKNYEGDDLVSQLVLGTEKEITATKSEIITNRLNVASDRTIIVDPNIQLEIRFGGTLSGTLKFNSGTFACQNLGLNNGTTVIIDEDVKITCRRNDDYKEIQYFPEVFFYTLFEGKYTFVDGYACVVDITMPEEKNFDDYFTIDYMRSGMIFNVNGKPVEEVSRDPITLLNTSKDKTYTLMEDYKYLGYGYYRSFTIQKENTLRINQNAHIDVGDFEIFGTLECDYRNFFHYGTVISMHNGSKLTMGDIKVEVENIGETAAFDASKVVFTKREEKINICDVNEKDIWRINITIPNGKFKDYFVIESLEDESEVYCNGKRVKK